MNTDFKSLEKRYGTSLATKICEEIARAEQRHFNFYRANVALKSMKRFVEDEFEAAEMAQNKVA
ncbi:MAG: acyl-ACP desaturase [Alphaproteobacteria bacterium]|nr:acyl-ACP desaturase [Alphaproteobacteria bacterium]